MSERAREWHEKARPSLAFQADKFNTAPPPGYVAGAFPHTLCSNAGCQCIHSSSAMQVGDEARQDSKNLRKSRRVVARPPAMPTLLQAPPLKVSPKSRTRSKRVGQLVKTASSRELGPTQPSLILRRQSASKSRRSAWSSRTPAR